MAEYICPNCGKPIYDDEALLCLYCGESLRRGGGFLGRLRYPHHQVIVVVVVAIVLLSFMLMFAL